MGYFIDGIRKLAWKGMASRIPGVNTFGGMGSKIPALPRPKMPAPPRGPAPKPPRYTAASNRTNDTLMEVMRRVLRGRM